MSAHQEHSLVDKLVKLILPVFCVFMIACHNSNVSVSTSPVYYTDDSAIQLPPLSSNKVTIDAPQHIEGTYGEKTFSMDGWMRMNDTLLNVILFSSFGNTLAEIKFTRDSISFESSMMDSKKFKAEYIIADIQLCFFEMSVLKPHFDSYGFTLTESREGNVTVRQLSKDGTKILTVEKNGDTTKLVNTLRNYTYTITIGQA